MSTQTETAPAWKVFFRPDNPEKPLLLKPGDTFEGQPVAAPGLLVCRSIKSFLRYVKALNEYCVPLGSKFLASVELVAGPADPIKDVPKRPKSRAKLPAPIAKRLGRDQ